MMTKLIEIKQELIRAIHLIALSGYFISTLKNENQKDDSIRLGDNFPFIDKSLF